MIETHDPEATAIVGRVGNYKGAPLQPAMAPICNSLLRRLERLYCGRWEITPFRGDCLQPYYSEGYAIVDRDANIRAGDLFVMGIRDFTTAFPERYTRGFGGMMKIFRGVTPGGTVEYCITNPAYVIQTGGRNVLYAYRVRAVAFSWLAAVATLWRARLNPRLFNAPLMEGKWARQ